MLPRDRRKGDSGSVGGYGAPGDLFIYVLHSHWGDALDGTTHALCRPRVHWFGTRLQVRNRAEYFVLRKSSHVAVSLQSWFDILKMSCFGLHYVVAVSLPKRRQRTQQSRQHLHRISWAKQLRLSLVNTG